MNAENRESAIRLIERIYIPRVIGLGFVFLAISISLFQNERGIGFWIFLILWGLIWPHLSHFWAKSSEQPIQVVTKRLYIDAFIIGFWVPVMSFNVIPSIAIMGMHLLSIISLFGLRKTAFGLLAELLGIVSAVFLLGFQVELETDMTLIFASLPILTLYPLLVGLKTYSLAVSLSARQAELGKLSRIDALTGLHNRMDMEEKLEQSFKRCQRNKTTASLIFIDVDHFKQVNDTYGHVVGDQVLQKIASLIQSCARDIDMCWRYGGEEFCLLMFDTDKHKAKIFSERLRTLVFETELHQENSIRSSISLGIAEYSIVMDCYNDWLALADKSLYRAKELGRNQTVVSE